MGLKSLNCAKYFNFLNRQERTGKKTDQEDITYRPIQTTEKHEYKVSVIKETLSERSKLRFDIHASH